MSALRTSTYLPVRDDAGLKSLSLLERDFVRSSALARLRTDGRRWDQVRPQRLQLVRGENTATVTVQWGSRVTCTCSATLLPPYPDRPNEGIVALSVDLSPAASTSFRYANPVVTAGGGGEGSRGGGQVDESQKLLTNRILRCLERILLTGGALDTEALCVTPDRWVWKLDLEVTVLDAAGGNLLDASVLACMASLRHYRKPHVELSSSSDEGGGAGGGGPILISSDIKEPIPLPLHHTPLALSFALVAAEDTVRGSSTDTTTKHVNTQIVALIDPSHREELVAAGSLVTLAMNVHGELCLLDYGGGCELQPSLLRQLHAVAAKLIQQELCPSLEKSLAQADEQSLTERLKRLQLQQDSFQQAAVKTLVEDDEDTLNIVYHQSASEGDSLLQVELSTNAAEVEAVHRAKAAAEEAYRRQALDYNLGHVATKVRENTPVHQKPSTNETSALLAAMLKSVSGPSTQQPLPMEIEKPVTEIEQESDKNDAIAGIKQEEDADMMEADKTVAASATLIAVAATAATTAPDSDDEDTTVQLKSEFQMIPQPSAPDTTMADADQDIDDLAGAIKKKKKKGKGGKK